MELGRKRTATRQLFFAFLLTLPIAWNRERADRVMGLRTFPLVAMASCGFMLLAQSGFAGNVEAQARVLQGIITGIGFIGAGAILKQDGSVKGSATAARIWKVGAMGAAVALVVMKSRSCSRWSISSSCAASAG